MSIPPQILDILSDPFFKHGMLKYTQSEISSTEETFLSSLGAKTRKRLVCLYNTLLMYIRSILEAQSLNGKVTRIWKEVKIPEVRQNVASFLIRRDPPQMLAFVKDPGNPAMLRYLRSVSKYATASPIDSMFDPNTGKKYEECS